MVKNRFAKDLKVRDIKISTEEVANEEGHNLRVSAMEIILEK
jgi:DNA-binding protein Alba